MALLNERNVYAKFYQVASTKSNKERKVFSNRSLTSNLPRDSYSYLKKDTEHLVRHLPRSLRRGIHVQLPGLTRHEPSIGRCPAQGTHHYQHTTEPMTGIRPRHGHCAHPNPQLKSKNRALNPQPTHIYSTGSRSCNQRLETYCVK